jgi:putative ABC transport system permease protein
MIFARAVRSLSRHPVRTGLTLAGIAVAAALLVNMVMLSRGLERSFEQLLLGRGFQVRITPKGTLPFDTEATLRGVPELLAALRADPEVAQAGALLGSAIAAATDTGDVPLVGYGVDPLAQGSYQLEAGQDLDWAAPGGLLIGRPVAERLGWAIGDSVVLRGAADPQTVLARSEARAVVRGIVRWLYDPRDQLSVGLLVPGAQRLAGLGPDRASVIMVRIAEDSAVARVTERLREAFPRVEVNNIESMVAQFRIRLTYFRQLAAILGTISLVVTVLLVGTVLVITVNERIGEIATLRVLGVPRHRILAQVLVEGLLVTVVGGGAGLALGLVTARWLDRILTSFPGLPDQISFFIADPGHLARAAVILLLAGLVAGLWPAWRAASTPLAPALREEGP